MPQDARVAAPRGHQAALGGDRAAATNRLDGGAGDDQLTAVATALQGGLENRGH